MESTNPVPAGWYADPAGEPAQRWWDGAAWTAAADATLPSVAPRFDLGAATAATSSGVPGLEVAPVGILPPFPGSAGVPTGGPAPGRRAGSPAHQSGSPGPYGPPGTAFVARRHGGTARTLGVVMVITVMVLVGAAALGVAVLGRDGSTAGTAVLPPTGPPAPDPGGQRFTDPQGVYEVQVPATWPSVPGPDAAMEGWQTEGPPGTNLLIHDIVNPFGDGFEESIRNLGPGMEQTSNSITVDHTDVVRSTTGHPVAVVHLSNRIGSVPVRQRMYVYVGPHRYVYVTVTTKGDEPDPVLSAIEPFALSLRILGDT